MALIIDSPFKKQYKSDSETSEQYNNRMTATRRWWRVNMWFIIISILILRIMLMLLLVNFWHHKSYEFIEMNIAFDVLQFLLFAIAIAVKDRVMPFMDLKLISAFFLIIFIGQRIASYSISEANKIKDGKTGYNKKHFSFKYGNKLIQTSDSLLSIGETSNYIFLYSMRDSGTMAIPFSKIDSLIIR
jgi:hypothetical protein